jgi:hypothetical protein
MNKIKTIAAGMAAIMSVSLLASCAGGAGSKTTVKEDDPWYESSRFLLERDQKFSEFMEGSCVGASDNNIYYLYSLYDMEGTDDYRRTVLDTYDNSGKLISSKEIDDSAFNVISGVKDIKVSDDGKTADVIASTWGSQAFHTSRLVIDLESGKVTDEIRFTDANGNDLEVDGFGVSDAAFAGDYCVASIYTSSSASYFLTVLYVLAEPVH